MVKREKGSEETRRSLAEGHGITFLNAEEATKWLKDKVTPEELNKVIEKILGRKLWEDGVYIADSLKVTMTIFQLKAIVQLAKSQETSGG